jgi:hypothetical protein
MSTIVHLPGPASSSHSHILTVSRHRVKEKMLQVQKTLKYQQFSKEFRYSSIDYRVIMMQTHNAGAGEHVRREEAAATSADSKLAPDPWGLRHRSRWPMSKEV